MSEEEFLESFLNYYFIGANEKVNDLDRKDIKDFLEEHHKIFYKVKFLKIKKSKIKEKK